MVPLYADCLLRCASDLDGVMETTCGHDPIKTAMEERQARERERYQRQTAFAAYRMSGNRVPVIPLSYTSNRVRPGRTKRAKPVSRVRVALDNLLCIRLIAFQ